MIQEVTVGATSIMAALLVATRTARWLATPVREPGRHRGTPQFVSLDDLLGPPSDYTSYRTLSDVPAPGPITPGFGWCDLCQTTTPGTINRSGFLCGHCLTQAGAA